MLAPPSVQYGKGSVLRGKGCCGAVVEETGFCPKAEKNFSLRAYFVTFGKSPNLSELGLPIN